MEQSEWNARNKAQRDTTCMCTWPGLGKEEGYTGCHEEVVFGAWLKTDKCRCQGQTRGSESTCHRVGRTALINQWQADAQAGRRGAGESINSAKTAAGYETMEGEKDRTGHVNAWD